MCVCLYSKYGNSKHVFLSFKDKHLLFSLLPIVVSRADSDGARRALDVHCVCTIHALVQSEFWVLTILWLAPNKPPNNKST